MTTGEIIQNKRKQLGWSQDQLAEKLNISRQSISKWEQDLALPDLENGSKICEVLGITVEELLHPTTNISTKQVNSENSFQSAEKFIRKSWHFSGLYLAFIGLAFSVAGFIFKLI
jgi:transcriptional regulator with XRE-family HTH domain